VREFVVAFDPAVYATAKQRARKIMHAAEAAEVSPEGYIAGGRECDFCPFSKLCGIARTSVPTGDSKLDLAVVAEVASLGREIIRLDQVAEQAATSLRERKEAMRNRLRELDVRRINGEGISVHWSSVKGRTTLDIDAMLSDSGRHGFISKSQTRSATGILREALL
jgi:hypothetical protein